MSSFRARQDRIIAKRIAMIGKTMRAILLVCLGLLAATPVGAENPAPYSGTKVIETGTPFAAFVDKLTAAVSANKMGIVAQACADCGAKSIGVAIPGNRVIMVYRPDFAVRMLKASVASGIEAPLRLYVTERPDSPTAFPATFLAPTRLPPSMRWARSSTSSSPRSSPTLQSRDPRHVRRRSFSSDRTAFAIDGGLGRCRRSHCFSVGNQRQAGGPCLTSAPLGHIEGFA